MVVCFTTSGLLLVSSYDVNVNYRLGNLRVRHGERHCNTFFIKLMVISGLLEHYSDYYSVAQGIICVPR